MIKRVNIVLSTAIIVVLLLSACAQQPVVQTVVVTQVVTEKEEVIVTQEVIVTKEVEVVVEPTAAPSGGEVLFGIYQEPQILNPHIATQTVSGEVTDAIIEGLVNFSPDGEYVPKLIEEIPTLDNGGVVVEGDKLVVTYKLLKDVKWSDGAPFTCDDVVFTWEAITDPDSGAVSTAGYDQITSIECPDENTAVVSFEPFFAPFMSLFSNILPRHATGAPAEMQAWPYNWHPVGTGPFKMTEWVPGDHITLVKNENYRDYPEKPYLDKLIFRVIPSREVGMAMIQTGEIDFLWDLIESVVPDLQDKPGVVVNITAGLGSERLVVNLADPALDATDDPLNHPHPLLGDLRVRKAIEAGINKAEINDILLFGAATVGTKEYNIGYFSEGCDIPASIYDPEAAMALLDEAGFTDQDGDGVRECHGCLYAKEGDPLRLKLQTTTGNKLREETEQLIIEYMKEIGIDMYIENVPSAELFGSWASGAFRKHGQFDIIMYTTNGDIDPHSLMYGYFGADQMPTEANGGSGYNYARWVNMEADAALKAAAATANLEERKQLYCLLMSHIADELPHIYLYDRAEIHATREGLVGYLVNAWGRQTWNVAEWRWEE
ncbi:MAG: peptide ABC transporter substrate-binding protein [Anaerolineales bacterium]|nr:peptide ABC transporter substrate-binding protein [Anaerolineales bacterium]